MASVTLGGIDKTYPGGVKALDNIDFEISSGEFFTLLGPSGCGKTTLLRTVAGFVTQDKGRVLIDGRPIDHVPAHKRDIGMVFQDYAIFPHMNVADNVAFGLKNRKIGKHEIAERVETSLHMARLFGFEKRMPNQLSGGQQQRVGLARAMVIRPRVLLMDEPLSNLDAKLRIEMREDIRDMQRELGITTIYVTHDQEEALVISDRICVMRDGMVQQIGRPWEIYKQPATRFAASFVGSMNFLDGVVRSLPGREEMAISIGPSEMPFRYVELDDAKVRLAIRPEDVNIVDSPDSRSANAFHLNGTIEKIIFTGREAHYVVDCGDGIQVTAQILRPTAKLLARQGEAVTIAMPLDKLLLFDGETQRRLSPEPPAC